METDFVERIMEIKKLLAGKFISETKSSSLKSFFCSSSIRRSPSGNDSALARIIRFPPRKKKIYTIIHNCRTRSNLQRLIKFSAGSINPSQRLDNRRYVHLCGETSRRRFFSREKLSCCRNRFYRRLRYGAGRDIYVYIPYRSTR